MKKKKERKLTLKETLKYYFPDLINYEIRDLIYNGYTTDYMIDTDGKIYSKNYKMSGKFKEMGQFNMKGYKMVNLTINHQYHRLLVHRLVALTFIPNPEHKPEVNHKDGNKKNNKASNLEWMTHKENMRHAIDNNLRVYEDGEGASQSTITRKQAEQICKLLEQNKLCLSDIAKEIGTTKGVVYNIKYGLTWKSVSKNYNVARHSIVKQRSPIINKQKVKKLSTDEVYQICELLQNTDIPIEEIAHIMGISKTRVETIRYKNAWKEIVKEYNFDHRDKYNPRKIYG